MKLEIKAYFKFLKMLLIAILKGIPMGIVMYLLVRYSVRNYNDIFEYIYWFLRGLSIIYALVIEHFNSKNIEVKIFNIFVIFWSADKICNLIAAMALAYSLRDF